MVIVKGDLYIFFNYLLSLIIFVKKTFLLAKITK